MIKCSKHHLEHELNMLVFFFSNIFWHFMKLIPRFSKMIPRWFLTIPRVKSNAIFEDGYHDFPNNFGRWVWFQIKGLVDLRFCCRFCCWSKMAQIVILAMENSFFCFTFIAQSNSDSLARKEAEKDPIIGVLKFDPYPDFFKGSFG